MKNNNMVTGILERVCCETPSLFVESAAYNQRIFLRNFVWPTNVLAAAREVREGGPAPQIAPGPAQGT